MFGSVFGHSVRARKRCKTVAFRDPDAILPGSQSLVDSFPIYACNLPKYTLEHVSECFWAFGSGTKNDAKRVHFGTRMHYCRVAKLGWIFSQRTHPMFLNIH